VRRLIVNADDFGFARDINEGIVRAHREGIVTATTLMANGPAFDDAVALAHANPALDVGCHLVLVGGRSLAHPSRDLPATIPRMVAALAAGRVRPYEEFAVQVRRIVDAGLRPTHLDTHKHAHILPPVLAAAARVAREFGIPWMRRVLSVGGRWLHPAGCRTTDRFLGFSMTGRFRTRELVQMIRSLPEGLTEFMCHPGLCGDELRSAPTRLREHRVRELEALTSAEARRAIEESGVRLVSYRELL
jgi:predicted glycoside hydrolase/deacetylase ChbG (UPF0249 family)